MSGWLDCPRIPARPGNYAKGRQGYRDIWFVLHCTDDNYADSYPTNLGHYWQRTLTKVSVHFGVSDTQVRQYVDMNDTAFQARNPANLRGVGVELSGLSRWSRNEWLAHKPMLRRAATLCAEVALERGYRLTPAKLNPTALRGRQSGLTQHADLTGCFGGSHTDLGNAFPWDFFTSELRMAMEKLDPQDSAQVLNVIHHNAAAATLEEDALMAVSDKQFADLAAKVNAVYNLLATGASYKGSNLQKQLGYVVERIANLGEQVESLAGTDDTGAGTAATKAGVAGNGAPTQPPVK